LAAACAMCCVTMAGFIVNDVYDKPKDALAFIQRPITVGLISSREAILGSGILFIIALCVTPVNVRSLAILCITAVSVVLYSAFACRFPVLKGVYTAFLCCAPLSYGAAVGGGQFSNTVSAALMLFITGREVYLDIRDFDGDSRFGLRTVPVIIGISVAQRLAVTLMIVGGLFTLILVRSTIGYLAAVSSFVLLGLILAWPGIELHRRLQLTRVPMVLGSFALASTVWSGQ
jgi:4-hydroxybenzoate polyprenyltransferase